jgi:Tol biopolymer transport system component
MKKLLPLFLAAALLVFTVSGCGSDPSPTAMSLSPTSTLPPPVETPPPPTETPTPILPTSLPPLSGSGGGVIAFVSDRDGNKEIYVMNADGTDQRRLTKQRFVDNQPAWSPDGTKIAFTSTRKGSEDIYVMDADGSAPRRLTTSQVNDFFPTWSPALPAGDTSSMQIAFLSDSGRDTEIYILNSIRSEGDPLQLTQTDDNVYEDHPAWSPALSEGGAIVTKIAFVSNRDGNDEIYVMDADGSNLRRLTYNDARDWFPAWSPDGTQIAFTSGRDGANVIYVMNPDGSDLRRLTHGDADAWRPAWSPDGTQIAFQSKPDSQWDIYVMNADGTDVRQLTTGGAADQLPAWRP